MYNGEPLTDWFYSPEYYNNFYFHLWVCIDVAGLEVSLLSVFISKFLAFISHYSIGMSLFIIICTYTLAHENGMYGLQLAGYICQTEICFLFHL